MAADDQSHPTPSGSRWEPPADGTGAPADRPATEQPGPGDATTAYPAGQAEPTRTPLRERRMIGIPVASAVAAGLVVASGLGGFALGSLTSGDDLTPVLSDGTGGRLGQLPGDGHLDHDGDGHGFPGGPGGYGAVPPDVDGDADQGVPPDLGDDGTDDGADEGTGATT